MLNNSERLLRVLGLDEIATQMLTPEERDLLVRFNEELDMLREEMEIPANCCEPDEVIDEAFQAVPAPERVLDKHTRILDNLLKAGSG